MRDRSVRVYTCYNYMYGSPALLLLHDDIESLDSEASGRRQRTSWRPRRNTGGPGTWPSYRGTSANHRGAWGNPRGTWVNHHRGAPANQGRRSWSQQLSHRDCYPLDQENLGLRSRMGWWVLTDPGTPSRGRVTPPNQRGASANQRGAHANQRGTQVNQRRTPANQNRTSLNQSGTSVNQHKTHVNQRGTHVNQGETSANQNRTSLNQSGTSTNQHKTHVNQRGTHVNQGGTSANQNRTSLNQSVTSADQLGTQVNHRGTQVNHRGTQVNQREAEVNQRRTLANQGGTSAREHRTLAVRRGTSANQRGTTAHQHGSSEDQHGISQPKQPPPYENAKLIDPGIPRWHSRLLWWLPRRTPTMTNVKRTWENQYEKHKKTEKLQNVTQSPQATKNQEPIREGKGETDPAGLGPKSLMFRDGRRRIDMVLAFETHKAAAVEERRRKQRTTFQENLIKEGLEVELEHKNNSYDGKTYFVKIHIPWETQLRMANIIGMKLPTERFVAVSVKAQTKEVVAEHQQKWYVRWQRRVTQIFDNKLIKRDPSFYGDMSKDRFLVKDRATEFLPSQCSLLLMQILLRTKYADEVNKVGIRRLLADGTYLACFPLHDGEYRTKKPGGPYSVRQLLYLEWARPARCYKRQPLWTVRRYFGDSIGLYYAWAGFYTKMLIPPAIVGFLCSIYGIFSSNSDYNIPSKEICDVNGPGNVTLCPLCDNACSYQKLSDSCFFSQISYLVDNPTTVFFSIFMSFWATSFLLLWKRKQSVIQWEWDLGGTDRDDNPRPEYEEAVKTTRVNPITGETEPYLPPFQDCARYVATYSVVFLMFALSIATVIGVIVYRIAMVTVIFSSKLIFIKKHARIFTVLTAALLNLIITELLIKVYIKVAIALTDLEKPRTQSDYEDSYTFKMYFFECINFYSSVVYIAFFKGAFFNHPGDHDARQSAFLRLKGDRCFSAGCLSELNILLTVLMVGKQTLKSIWKFGFLWCKTCWRNRVRRAKTLDPRKPYMPWEVDYQLQENGYPLLFAEFLEMIMQYGFVTLFVAACPLGPLFALLHNLYQIRLDAYNMVVQERRPLAERIEGIGAWLGILQLVTYMAVVSNAFVIAYTSDFIPRMVYKLVYSPNGTLVGYVNHSLSWFNTSDYVDDWGVDSSEWDPPLCAFRGFRNAPDDPNPYSLSPYYWHVFSARLAFVVLFEHVVFSVTELMHWLVSTVPHELRIQKKREALLEKEIKFEHIRESAADWKMEKHSGLMGYLKSKMDGEVPDAASKDAGVRLSSDVEGLLKTANLTIDEDL